MINNFVDHRSNKYKVLVDVAFEPSWHDNSIEGATQFPKSRAFTCEFLYGITIVEAIQYANRWDCATTMYIYDENVLAREALK
jgi:hypothetical protein